MDLPVEVRSDTSMSPPIRMEGARYQGKFSNVPAHESYRKALVEKYKAKITAWTMSESAVDAHKVEEKYKREYDHRHIP